jgi:universal stress protein E
MATSYKSIVVGVDFSACSTRALRVAADLALRSGAAIRVIHFIHAEVAEEERQIWHTELSEVIDGAYQELGRFIERAIPSTKDLQLKVEVQLGHRFVGLLKAIEDAKADLLILGAHGRHHPNQQRTGLLSSKCVRRAPCEVMLVTENAAPPFERILVAVDYSANSKLALEEALRIADFTKAKIHVVHVSLPPWLFLLDQGVKDLVTPKTTKEAFRNQQQQAMDAFLSAYDRKIEASIVERPSLVPGVIETQRQLDADLIVLGNRGQTAAELVLLGSFAERLIRDCQCTVLAVKPEGRGK